MTKKHFQMIAAKINAHLSIAREDGEVVAIAALSTLANSLSIEFGDFNPNFDRARFLAACGVTRF